MRTDAAASLTVLFTDVAGSTELRSRYGDDRADAVLRRHEEIVRRSLSAHQGRQIQFLGDGFLATFTSPRAAADCAVHVQRATAAHDAAASGEELHVRIGLHHGPVTERDGHLYGQTLHAAARITAEAAGDQILLSRAVRDALVEDDPGLPIMDRGLYWLKGFSERWRLYELRWRSEPVATPASAALTPFVEREGERAALRRALDEARAGRGSFVVVTGEAGVGKSRLITEVASEAEAHGMQVLVGHCVQMEGSPPYLPFVEMLEDALIAPSSPLSLREALGDAGPEIARMVPSLRRVVPGLPPAIDLPAEQAPRYLWNSVLAWLERAAGDRPLMLVVEDLHWADGSTVQLLEHLAVHLPRLPVLLIGSYRDVEVGIEDPLARIVLQLARRRLVTRVALTRLSARGVAAMLRGLAGREPPAALVDAIDAEAEGNPFFVEEVYLHLAETGRLLDEQGEFRHDLRFDELDVPDSVRMVMAERLARLSAATLDVLLAAAVSGRAFSSDVLAQVTGLPAEAMVAALDEAERARLVMPARPGRLLFSHELIRQTLLADVSSVRREELHARTAGALEQVHADDPEPHAEDIAFHLLRAGPLADPGRLVRHLVIAGDRAMQASASQDALAHSAQALAAAGPGEPGRRAQLLERLALARRGVGDWEAALTAMDEALGLYQDLGRLEDLGRLCWVMVYQLSWTARYEQAMQVSARGLAALGERAHPDRARLLAATAWVVSLAGDYGTATGLFAQARGLAGNTGGRAMADVLHMETFHHMGFAELREGIDVGSRAAEVFEAEGSLWDLCGVLAFVMFLTGTLSRREGTDELADRVADLAARLGHLGAGFLEAVDRSRRAIMRADLAELRALAATQIELCEQGGMPWLYVGYLYLGLAAFWRGDGRDAERQLRRATELEPVSAFAGQSAAQLAVMLAYAGRVEEVSALFRERAGSLPDPDRVSSLGAWNALLGFTEALYVSGLREEAASGYQLIADAVARTGDWTTFDGRLASTRAGLAAAAGGRFDEAQRHYRSALETAEAIDHRLERADVQRFLAWLHLDRRGPGDDVRASHLLDQARDGYRRLGLREPRPPAFLAQLRPRV